MSKPDLTEAEYAVLQHLIDAWNAFNNLPAEHDDDKTEFRHGMHMLQRMVLSRPTRRLLHGVKLK